MRNPGVFEMAEVHLNSLTGSWHSEFFRFLKALGHTVLDGGFLLGPCAFADAHSFKFPRACECRHGFGLLRAFIFGNARHWKDHAHFEFRSSFGNHLEVFCVFGRNVEDSKLPARFLQAVPFIAPGCNLLFFASLIVWAILWTRSYQVG